jgi:hypothetical protein
LRPVAARTPGHRGTTPRAGARPRPSTQVEPYSPRKSQRRWRANTRMRVSSSRAAAPI